MQADGDDGGSITKVLGRMGQLDEQATQLLWDHFFSRLCQFAEAKIYPRHRRNISPDEIASTAFMSLVDGFRQKRFANLRNRDDLWQLLTLIAARRTINEQRKHDCAKRGNGKVSGQQAFGRSGINGIIDYVQLELSAVDYADLEELVQSLIHFLPDDSLQKVAEAKLGGFSNIEIALQLGCAERTVERKLALIRRIWIERTEKNTSA